MQLTRTRAAAAARTLALALSVGACAAAGAAPPERPWMNTALPADARAQLLEQALTPDERLALLHSPMATEFDGTPRPPGSLGSAGYVAGVARLGLPALNETDASLGVTNPDNVRPGDTATALPSGLALAASWNPQLARASGAAIGREAHAKGFNVLLAGGANLARDPRGGRNFEYLGEDPWLAGVMAGTSIAGIQSAHVVSTVKHFALNPYETGRDHYSANIDAAALRESDLLAFELAIERGQPGAVMCAYNKVNGAHACENDYLLGDVLKRDWAYPGWVMSDWGAVHSTAAARVLDHESGEQLDTQVFFGEPLKQAVAASAIAPQRISDMVRRILRSMFAAGLFDHPPAPAKVDYPAHAGLARQVAAEGIVLLRNERATLPLSRQVRRVAVIGGNASLGVLSGGGSSQVTPTGEAPLTIALGGNTVLDTLFRRATWFASPPLQAIRARAPGAEVVFDDGRYPARAAELARGADVAIVFGTQWCGEAEDVPDLSLPQGQDALVAAVTAANPRTVVVLETGNPVDMPWLAASAAVLQAWYPGQEGGEAIADVLFGVVTPSGRLPMTFPRSVRQLPRPALPGPGQASSDAAFDIAFNEGADVGYRWFARTGEQPLYPFGFGLSYTTFAHSGLQVRGGRTLTVSLDVANTGSVAGADVPQVYLSAVGNQPMRRLIGWDKVALAPGEHRRVSIEVDPRLLARFDPRANRWQLAAGDYRVMVGTSASDASLEGTARLAAMTIKP
ncbi:beta-glucosidase family protein [Rugamonas apoptosis]|uniref:Glycoside hydrolase family 3 C-terminal domain-containing protein n=1 Tax=Rugamonas apoptosis TaxID=2758570 RepID=A0A7W2IJZ4_9BURK|nr:glycoside hydrolase family 3 C-terminal domain-containing protein [Rugamonas apoptosis]MBA5687033.1 glycoside hydrolase family 3 C-terminal domain-containing protein [Rugamonas apoptosis]